MNLVGEAPRVAEEAEALLAAPPCPAGRRTIVLDGGQLALQVHESCGHPIELDRVLGMELSYAGDSFLTIDKLGTFQYGSPQVNIVADATAPGGLGTFGWDDEGVPAQRTPIIEAGRFVGYLSSRETAPAIGRTVQRRHAGERLAPHPAHPHDERQPAARRGRQPGRPRWPTTGDGLFLATNKSWSIDNKRLNFQFGVEMCREIKGGRLGTNLQECHLHRHHAGVLELLRRASAARRRGACGARPTAARASPARPPAWATARRRPGSATSR